MVYLNFLLWMILTGISLLWRTKLQSFVRMTDMAGKSKTHLKDGCQEKNTVSDKIS